MEFTDKFFEISIFISNNIITRIYLLVLVLILLKIYTNKKNDISTGLKIIKWIIIVYSIITLIGWLLIFIFPSSKDYAIIDRTTDTYAWAYLIMLFFNCIFPFILLIKKIGENIFLVFLVSVLMNFGWLFERFIIITTSIHRDYLP